MRREIIFYLAVGGLFMFPRKAMGKRAAPPDVPPVTHDGIRYFAVCEGIGSREASCAVVARKPDTGKELWKTLLYRVRYDKNKETDVQDVWPRSLTVEGGEVVVTGEMDEVFRLDLKSGELKSPRGRERALTIAREKISGLGAARFVIIEDETLERDFGWVFFYTTPEYLRTGNPNDLIPGNGPLIVERENGAAHFLTTSVSPAAAIDVYEEAWRKTRGNETTKEIGAASYSARRELRRGETLQAKREITAAISAYREGIAQLGSRYGSPDLVDDTGTKEVLAKSEETKGNLETAANLLHSVLESRVDAYETRHPRVRE